MIRPHIDITMHMGYISKVYPNMQWNENTSQRKMLADLREWLHNHHPSWRRAMVHLSHFNGTRTHSDVLIMEMGQLQRKSNARLAGSFHPAPRTSVARNAMSSTATQGSARTLEQQERAELVNYLGISRDKRKEDEHWDDRC